MPTNQSIAIIPAAGRSRRMGRHKLLLAWGDTTVIQHVLSVWKSSQITHVVVVVRPDDRRLANLCQDAGVDVVVPSVAPAEMKVSVQHALRYVQQAYHPKPTDVWLLAPADIPQLDVATIDLLLTTTQDKLPSILVPTTKGHHGHPVLFPWTLSGQVHGLDRDQGVHVLLQRHSIREIACQKAGVLGDMDTPDDYRQLLRRSIP